VRGWEALLEFTFEHISQLRFDFDSSAMRHDISSIRAFDLEMNVLIFLSCRTGIVANQRSVLWRAGALGSGMTKCMPAACQLESGSSA
jgi:hypothetical protein